jgi:hypothetical protein
MNEVNTLYEFYLQNQNIISLHRSNHDKTTATREQGGFGCQTLQM